MKKIGFIGVGIMGKSMVRNLMKAGFDVAIYTRTKSKVEDVICEGAAWRDSVKECVADRDAVITIVGYPKDVEEVYFGEGGILKNAPTGAYVIDMTTSSPKLAERIYEEAKAVGLYALDAPVTGGDSGAKAGTRRFWQAATGKLLMPACRYLRPWERILIMKERQEMDSIQRCATRLRLQEHFPAPARLWPMPRL